VECASPHIGAGKPEPRSPTPRAIGAELQGVGFPGGADIPAGSWGNRPEIEDRMEWPWFQGDLDVRKMVRARGLEPPTLAGPDPKSGASAIPPRARCP
jgi:hypothetical protein